MHAVAVIFDFVEPLVAVWRFFDKLRQLRPYPFRQAAGWPRTRFFAGRAMPGAGRGFVRWSMRLFTPG
jgi:hypothetical protein